MSSVIASKFRARAVDHLALAVGTTKGLFLVSDAVVDGPFLKGESVGGFLQVRGRYLAAAVDERGRATVRTSVDGGLSWSDPHPIGAEADGSVVRLFADRRPDAGGVVWAAAGTSLFTSDDSGEDFELAHDFAADLPGSSGHCGCAAAVRAVGTHPERPERLVVALSGAGICVSEDGGKSFAPPGGSEEVAENPADCVYGLAIDAGEPDTWWAQTHSGLLRTDDAGRHWERTAHTGEATGLPTDFGLAVVAHPDEADTAWVVPLDSPGFKCTPGRWRVYRTVDGGRSWEALADGLPGSGAYVKVPGDCLAVAGEPPYPLVVGSGSGHLFASMDAGDSWRQVAAYLPPIRCVRVLD